MAGKMTDDIVRCSFCGKTQAQVRKLIAGPNGTYICDECIGICSEIIEEELDYNDDRELFDDINLLTPEEMKNELRYLRAENAYLKAMQEHLLEKKRQELEKKRKSSGA